MVSACIQGEHQMSCVSHSQSHHARSCVLHVRFERFPRYRVTQGWKFANTTPPSATPTPKLRTDQNGVARPRLDVFALCPLHQQRRSIQSRRRLHNRPMQCLTDIPRRYRSPTADRCCPSACRAHLPRRPCRNPLRPRQLRS